MPDNSSAHGLYGAQECSFRPAERYPESQHAGSEQQEHLTLLERRIANLELQNYQRTGFEAAFSQAIEFEVLRSALAWR